MVAAEKLLGRGIYTPHEAALYARISAKMMVRWGSWHKNLVAGY